MQCCTFRLARSVGLDLELWSERITCSNRLQRGNAVSCDVNQDTTQCDLVRFVSLCCHD